MLLCTLQVEMTRSYILLSRPLPELYLSFVSILDARFSEASLTLNMEKQNNISGRLHFYQE